LPQKKKKTLVDLPTDENGITNNLEKVTGKKLQPDKDEEPAP
jgi:hypothetical protein